MFDRIFLRYIQSTIFEERGSKDCLIIGLVEMKMGIGYWKLETGDRENGQRSTGDSRREECFPRLL